MNQNQIKTIDVLKNGGIVAYPTDTTYGIGCEATLIDSVKKVFEIKGRDWAKPLSIACSSMMMIKEYAFMSRDEETLLEKIFPGPVTVLLRKKTSLPDLVTAGSSKVGVRIPDYPDLLEIISALGKPVITTSANISGQADPTSEDEIDNTISSAMDYVLPGSCRHGKPSTIIDLENKQILRAGVDKDRYRQLLDQLKNH